MTKVYVALINGGVWFVAANKAKLAQRIEVELAGEHIEVERDSKFEAVTLTDFIAEALEAGECGEALTVNNFIEYGDDYTEVAFREELVC